MDVTFEILRAGSAARPSARRSYCGGPDPGDAAIRAGLFLRRGDRVAFTAIAPLPTCLQHGHTGRMLRHHDFSGAAFGLLGVQLGFALLVHLVSCAPSVILTLPPSGLLSNRI